MVADFGNLDRGEGKVGESGRGWMWTGLGLKPRGGMIKGWQLEVGCSRGGGEKSKFLGIQQPG